MSLIKVHKNHTADGDYCLYYGRLCNINDIRQLSERDFRRIKAQLAKEQHEHILGDLESEGDAGGVKGFVYAAESGGFVKIGSSLNPAQRLKSIATHSPNPVRLLKTWQCDDMEQAEGRLHASCREFRVRGEWFRLPPTKLKALLSLESI